LADRWRGDLGESDSQSWLVAAGFLFGFYVLLVGSKVL